MIGIGCETADVRLAFWQQLLQEVAISTEDIDRELLPLARAGTVEERTAYVLLRAAVVAFHDMTPAMQRNLKAAVIHWFSSVGSPAEDSFEELIDIHELRTIVGRRLTWADSTRLVGGNPNDYSAYRRLVDRLERAIREEWSRAFGELLPSQEAN